MRALPGLLRGSAQLGEDSDRTVPSASIPAPDSAEGSSGAGGQGAGGGHTEAGGGAQAQWLALKHSPLVTRCHPSQPGRGAARGLPVFRNPNEQQISWQA